MLRSELRERLWQVPIVTPRQDRTLEVANPRRGSTAVKLPKPNARLRALAPGELVTVHTRNSIYRLIVLDSTGHNILIQGGRHFPCSTEACLVDGSTVPELLVSTLEFGCNLQFLVGDRCFMTSPIVKIEREGANVRAAIMADEFQLSRQAKDATLLRAMY